MDGLCLDSIGDFGQNTYEPIRVVQDCKIALKRCLFLRPGSSSRRERRSLSTDIVALADDRHGEHRASREAGDGAHRGRE